MRTAVLAGLTALTLYLCWVLLRPHLVPLVWAVALAVVTRPLHVRIRERLGRPALAAGLSAALVATALVAPAILVGQQLFHQASEGLKTMQKEEHRGRWRALVDKNPRLAPVLASIERRGGNAASQATQGVAARLPGFLGTSARGVMEAAIAVFALFFLYRDEEPALRLVRSLSPLDGRDTRRVLRRVHDTIWATMFGTVVMAAVQGFLGGLIFAILGLPAPVLWGVVMAFLAIVPVLGAFIVWVPAAAFLALEGEVGKALVLTAFGALVVSGVDNVLYPALVGRRMRLHTLAVFLALLGGIAVVGAAGIVIGPVVLATAQELLRIWKRRTAPRPARTRSARPERAPVTAGA